MEETRSETSRRTVRGQMTEGNPARCLILFVLPMIGGNLFQQLYNIVDSIIVGRVLGADALAAVGASTSICMLFVMIAIGTGIGCSVIISQLFGAGDIKKMKTAVSTAVSSIFAFSILLSILGRLLSPSILQWMKTPQNIFPDATTYLNIYFYGFTFLFMYNCFTAVFNALGDSKKPLIFLMISSILNIGLDLLFVAVFEWGIAGAAWATLISQALSAVISALTLYVKLHRIPVDEKSEFYNTQLLKKMVSMAVPTVLQQSIVSIGAMLVQSVVNRFGSGFLAGYTAAVKVDGIAILPMVNIGNAAATFVAQNLGAGKPDRAKQGYHVGVMLAISTGLFVGILVHFFAPNLVAMFLDASAAQEATRVGIQYLTIVALFYFMMGTMNSTGAVLRGAGDMRWFTMGTLLNLCARVSITFLFADMTGGMIVMWAIPTGWLVAFVIFFARYRSGKWKSIRLIK